MKKQLVLFVLIISVLLIATFFTRPAPKTLGAYSTVLKENMSPFSTYVLFNRLAAKQIFLCCDTVKPSIEVE